MRRPERDGGIGRAWRLRRAAASIRSDSVALQQLIRMHGPGGHGAVLLLLAAPCLLPVPGVGTVLGVGLGATAWAMWHGRDIDPLPERVSDLAMPRAWARRVLAMLARLYLAAERVARPRWPGLTSAAERTWMPPLVALMALLIVLPIPFGNVLPAASLVLLGIGLVFVDGLFLVGAAVVGGFAALFPIGLAWASWHWGADVIQQFLTG